MRRIVTIMLCIASTAVVLADETDLKQLDPKEQQDRNVLIQIVKRSTNGKSNRAAKILAQAGYMDDLLDILRTTTSYNTMGAIAQTRNERTIPIFEDRLRKTPNNRYLIGSLAYVQNRKASPVLMLLLKMHSDGDRPNDQDTVGCILNAMIFNKCQAAIPLLRQRFAACDASTSALKNRKSYYACVLVALGDPTGIQWLVAQLRADIDSQRDSSWAADKLATICDWMPPKSDLVNIQDEGIMEDLLPALTTGASIRGHFLARDCRRVLRVLTRHDFAAGDIAWQKWYEEHRNEHPVYTKPLDRAVLLCMNNFKRNLAEVAKKNERVKRMGYFLGDPQNGCGGHNDFLWKLESHPEKHSLRILEFPYRGVKERKTLGILFQACLGSRAPSPDLVFKKEFAKINVIVQLCLRTMDEETKGAVIDCAKRACEVLSTYEESYEKTKHAEPNAALDGAKTRRK